jgi:hypothetical protein
VVTRVQCPDDGSPHEHELVITPRGPASIVSDAKTKADLRPEGP